MNESVATWVNELSTNSSGAMDRLVFGTSAVAAWSRSTLREIFAETFTESADALDNAVTGWLNRLILQPPPPGTPTVVWASHLQEVFRGLAGLPLPELARLLRGRLRDFRTWLRPLRNDESLDPEAAYLAALAWAETNAGIEGMWRRIALREEGEPPYYTDIGLLGLRKSRDDDGNLPAKAPFALLSTLIDIADAGISQREWLLTTRSVLGGYPYRVGTWLREFQPVLRFRYNATNGPKWLAKVFPEISTKPLATTPTLAPAHSREEKEAMISAVAVSGPAAVSGRLAALVARERYYAYATNDPYFLVRTFNRLAEAAIPHAPDWAVACAEEALTWDPKHEFCWTTLAHSIWARGQRANGAGQTDSAYSDFREALDLLWEARFRFPYNAHMRNELAKLLRLSGDLETAEVVYREAISEFPLDPWALKGLADLVLRRSSSLGLERARHEARSLFERAAALGDSYAADRLRNLDREQEGVLRVDLAPILLSEMRPAQRLGRALLLQWNAQHAGNGAEAERLYSYAEKLLDLPEVLAGDCWMAFVEARGFLILARGRLHEARAYFERCLLRPAGNSIAIRLGLSETRARLGERLSDRDEAELAAWGPDGGILPLVLRVVRLLEVSNSDDDVRRALLELYPRVTSFAASLDREGGDRGIPANQPQYNVDKMVAQILLAKVFEPAAVRNVDDLSSTESISRVRASLRARRDDLFSVATKIALAA